MVSFREERARQRSQAITSSLAELKRLSADIRVSAVEFENNLRRVAKSDVIAEMKSLLGSIR